MGNCLPRSEHGSGLLFASLGNCESCLSDLAEKRAKVVFQIIITYTDVAFDTVNAIQLYNAGNKWWAGCIAMFMLLPNCITWFFLRANGMATWFELPIVVFQLGPLYELSSTWATGDFSPGMIWYTVAEGLGEAPLTTVLTTYILAFGGDYGWTFYVGVLWSLVSISKTATVLNFYGQEAANYQKMVEFIWRLPDISLRICFLACFGYLMKQTSVEDDEIHHSTQTALEFYYLLSIALNVGMIKMCEPKCSLQISLFFGATMIFTPPPRLLTVFERMATPFQITRYFEMIAIAGIAVCPLDPNPRLSDLMDNAPFLVYLATGSVAAVVLVNMGLFIWAQYRSPAPSDYSELQDEDDLLTRAKKVRDRLRSVADARDFISTGLIASLEGADLKDNVLVFIVINSFPEKTKETLHRKGLPRSVGADFHQSLFYHDLAKLHAQRPHQGKADWCQSDYFAALGNIDLDPAQDSMTLALIAAGCSIDVLKAAGFELSVSHLQPLKDAGTSLRALNDAGFGIQELIDACTSLRALKDAGFGTQECVNAGTSLRALNDAGFDTSIQALIDGGTSLTPLGLRALKDAGCSLPALIDAGTPLCALSGAGFNIQYMFDAGVKREALEAAFGKTIVDETISEVNRDFFRIKASRLPSWGGRLPKPEARAMTLREFRKVRAVVKTDCDDEKWEDPATGERLNPAEVNTYHLSHCHLCPRTVPQGIVLRGFQCDTSEIRLHRGDMIRQSRGDLKRPNAEGKIVSIDTGDIEVEMVLGRFVVADPGSSHGGHAHPHSREATGVMHCDGLDGLVEVNNWQDPRTWRASDWRDTRLVLGVPREVHPHAAFSYKEILSPEPRMPAWFCSQWWGESVFEFVACLEDHARLRDLVADEASYWVCAYSNCQHTLEDDMGKDPENSSFRRALSVAGGVLLVLDRQATPFKRIWCDYELYITLTDTDKLLDIVALKGGEPVLLSDGLLPTESGRSKIDREESFPIAILAKGLSMCLQDGEASVESDRELILEDIQMSAERSHFFAGLGLNGSERRARALEWANAALHARIALAAWPQAVKLDWVQKFDGNVSLPYVLKADETRHTLNLSLSDVKGMSDKDLQALASGLSDRLINLRLHFDYCVLLTDAGLVALAAELPMGLKALALHFFGCTQLTDEGLASIAIKLPAGLQELNLSFSSVPRISRNGLVKLAAHFPKSLEEFGGAFSGTEVDRDFHSVQDFVDFVFSK